jgi:ankyrin repeat protein
MNLRSIPLSQSFMTSVTPFKAALLHMAVEAKSTALVDLLATAKANPDAVDVDGNTPLVS